MSFPQHPPPVPRTFSKEVTTLEEIASFLQLLGSSKFQFPASPLLHGPRSRPELPAATPLQPCHSPERVKFRRAPAPVVNPGFSALISQPVICISLLCAGFSSSLSPGPGTRISIPRRLQGAPCCVPACAICRRHQFFSTFLISHYSQAQAAPHSTPSPAVLPASWRARAVMSLPDPPQHALAC